MSHGLKTSFGRQCRVQRLRDTIEGLPKPEFSDRVRQMNNREGQDRYGYSIFEEPGISLCNPRAVAIVRRRP